MTELTFGQGRKYESLSEESLRALQCAEGHNQNKRTITEARAAYVNLRQAFPKGSLPTHQESVCDNIEGRLANLP